MKKVLVLLMVAALATASQAVTVDSFANLDFDSGAVTTGGPGFKGFDAPWATEIIGWTNYPAGAALNDAGVEAVGAWWGPYETNSAFMSTGDGAYNMSSYTIQAGDAFTVGFMAKEWWNNIYGEWTVTLFYDDPANVIGTYVSGDLTNTWTAYSSDVIAATPASVGGTLGILFESTGTSFANMDEVTVNKERLGYNSPADGATLISTVLTSADNDLVFSVYDSVLGANDVEVYLTAHDPNAPTLITTLTAPGTGQQTVTLESELASDLAFETIYYWKVVGYEPNTVDPNYLNLVSGPIWSFTTAPAAPLVTLNPVAYTAVDAGEPSVVLTANGINGTFKWYKDGVAIDDGVDYTGTTTGSLTINDVQQADEGYYTMKITNDPLVAESTSARVMIHRQTSYYDFESITTIPDGNDIYVDSIDGYQAVVMQESASAGLPTSVTDANSIAGLGAYLYLNNADHATDPNGQYLQVAPGVVDYEDITISLWVHPLGGNEWQRILDFGDGTADYLFLTPDAGGSAGLRYATRINGGGEQQLNTGWLAPGSWYYVTVAIGGNTGKLYVNGEWRSTNTNLALNPIDVGAVLNYIGKSQYPDAEFNGYIDDLKIYNYARTNQQIAEDYMAVTGDAYVCDTEALDLGDYDANGDCQISLPDFAAFAARWLETDQFLAP